MSQWSVHELFRLGTRPIDSRKRFKPLQSCPGPAIRRVGLPGWFLLGLLLMGLMTGCATQRLGEFQVVEGRRFPAEHVALIDDGVTREVQVYELFGTPWQKEQGADGDILRYWFVESKTDETAGFLHGETDELRVERKLEVKIANGVVRAHDYSERKTRTTTSNRF